MKYTQGISTMFKAMSASLLALMASIVLYQGSHYTVVTASKSPVQAIVFDLDGVLFTTSKKMHISFLISIICSS